MSKFGQEILTKTLLQQKQSNILTGIRVRKSIYSLFILVLLITSGLVFTQPTLSSAEMVENSWVPKASMQEARSGLGVAVVDGKIYAIGGLNSSYKLVDTNEMHDPATNTWTTLKPMPTPRARFGIAVCQNKIYIIGGEIGSRPTAGGLALAVSVVTGINEVYDPVTDTWEIKKPDANRAGCVKGKRGRWKNLLHRRCR